MNEPTRIIAPAWRLRRVLESLHPRQAPYLGGLCWIASSALVLRYQALGLDARAICDSAEWDPKNYHAWVKVRFEGRWWFVDVTMTQFLDCARVLVIPYREGMRTHHCRSRHTVRDVEAHGSGRGRWNADWEETAFQIRLVQRACGWVA